MQLILLVMHRIDFVALAGGSIDILRPIVVDRSGLVPMSMCCFPRHRSAVLMFNHIAFASEPSSRFAASFVGGVLLFLLLDGLEFLRILAIFIGGLVTYEWRLDWFIAAGFTFVLISRPPTLLPSAVILQFRQLPRHPHLLLVELLLDDLHFVVETSEVVLELIRVHGF